MADNSITLQKTPLYEAHARLGAKMSPFGGWLMPIQYEGILAEHAYTRSMVSVFDICHMGEFLLEGDAVASGLDRIVTQNIVSMPEGSCRYGFMLNEYGGVIDDLIVYRLEKEVWMIVVNAATIATDQKNFQENLLGNSHFDNVSGQLGKLDVQGPRSSEVMSGVFGVEIHKLDYYSFGEFTFNGESCIISRTGYTGELGYEVYVPVKDVASLWEIFLKDGVAKPAGLGCRDTLRLEMGYPLYGHELDINHTPIAACLDKFVDFSKDFIGKEALLRQRKSGPKERLVCFKASSRRAPRNGFAIFKDGKQVGMVTSGSFSPSLSVGIGMGYVSGDNQVGTELIIKDANIEIPVEIVSKPFYKTIH